MRIIFLAMFVFFISSCSGEGEGEGEDEGKIISCTEEFVYGIRVDLYDASTNEEISVCNTSYTINEGEYLEEGSSSDMSPCENTTFILGVGERSGVYNIEISKIGYESWQAEEVIVDSNICHVETMNIEAFLVPVS